VVLPDDVIVDAGLVTEELEKVKDELIVAGEPAGRVTAAVDLLRAGALAEELPEFLSLLALDQLDA
jgi:hypothetical protein